MKKIYFLFLLVSASAGAFAQYVYTPYLNANINPGGLNTDAEYPVGGGLTTGWTSIHSGSAASPAWSTTVTIPFSFMFNGAAVTSYKVSTSGILTFTTGAVTPPSYTAATLPNASIPDNSVVVWGIQGSGTNDNICHKTFGTAPNRQHWIFFTSYTMAAPAATTCYTYWSVVLEESSNNIYIVDQRHVLTCTAQMSLGVQINSTTATQVPGAPNTANVAGADATPIDNTYYEFIRVSNNYDLQGTAITTPTVLGLTAAPFTVAGTLKNVGFTTITTMDLNYQVGSGPVQTTSLSGLNIASLQSYAFTHPAAWTPVASGNYTVKAWASNLNGNPDQNTANDEISKTITVGSFLPSHRIIVEEGTGTWCGWCPRGTVYMDSLEGLYPNTSIGIAVHNADPMTNTAYDAGVSAAITGYPSVLINRNIVDDPSNILNQYSSRIGDFGYADLTLANTFDNVTRVLTGNASANFAFNLNGTYRLAMILTEDNVTGTTSAYNQVNYYAGGGNGTMAGWELLPNPVPAANMVYDHVAVEIVGGFSCQTNSLPTTLADGSTYNYTFSYTVPAANNIANMHAYLVLFDVANNTFLNGTVGTLNVGVSELHPNITDVSMYPNPVMNGLLYCNISAKKEMNTRIEILDVLGRKVLEQNLGEISGGNTNLSVNLQRLNPGLYTFNVLTGEDRVVRKIVVQK